MDRRTACAASLALHDATRYRTPRNDARTRPRVAAPIPTSCASRRTSGPSLGFWLPGRRGRSLPRQLETKPSTPPRVVVRAAGRAALGGRQKRVRTRHHDFTEGLGGEGLTQRHRQIAVRDEGARRLGEGELRSVSVLGGCGSEGALQARDERTASRAGVLETVGDESVRERRVADLVLGELGERAGDGRIRGGVCVWAASSAADVCPMQPLDEGAMNELGQRGALEGTAHVERAWAEALAGIGARAAEADLGVCRLIGEGSIRFCDQRGGRGVLQLSRRQTTSIEAMLRSPEFVRFAGLSRESACGVRGPYARPLV